MRAAVSGRPSIINSSTADPAERFIIDILTQSVPERPVQLDAYVLRAVCVENYRQRFRIHILFDKRRIETVESAAYKSGSM